MVNNTPTYERIKNKEFFWKTGTNKQAKINTIPATIARRTFAYITPYVIFPNFFLSSLDSEHKFVADKRKPNSRNKVKYCIW